MFVPPESMIDIDTTSIRTFQITIEEARALIILLDHEFIPREPLEMYEQIMRLFNGLSEFVDKYEK